MKRPLFSSHCAVIVLLGVTRLQAADLTSLTQRLISADNRQRETAAREVMALPLPEQKQAATRLIPLLKGTDTDQREYAAEALAKLGPASEPAIAVLQSNLSDDFPYVRIRSAEALAHIGPAAVPAFIEALKNDNKEVRLVTVQALVHIGAQAEPAIPALVQVLDDPEAPIRKHAASALENIGADAAPKLMAQLAQTTFKNQIGLVKVLGAIEGTPQELPGRLMPFLSDTDPELRLAAAKALAHKGQTAVSAVSQGLSSDSPLVRMESADILADMGPEATLSISLLISLLKDPDAHVRAAAAHALGKMRDAASSAIPNLKDALNDTDPNVTARAQEALTAITVTSGGPHEPKDAYVPSVGHEQPVPLTAAKPKAKPAVRTPAPQAKKPRASTKKPSAQIQPSFLTLDSTASIHALEMTAQKGAPQAQSMALAALSSLLASTDEKTRAAAAETLGRVGTPEAKKILDPYLKQEELKKINRLMVEIQTSTSSIKNAIDTLIGMGPVAVPAAVKALKDSKAGTRLAAAQIVEKLGAAASVAVPRLIDLLNDSDAAVRGQAAKALEVMNKPEAKNPLRLYYFKEKIRPYLALVHISI